VTRWRAARSARAERGAAVVDFVLVVVVLVPLLLGLLQLGLVLHVRNTLAAAASAGARYAATVDRGPTDGMARTQQIITGILAERFAGQVSAAQTDVGGYPGIVVQVEADVPPLGLWGPAVHVAVEGHAVEETLP
jgi:Flp pilus assembly protein TadG